MPRKKKIKLSKPMGVGVSALDLSKLHMYRLFYEVLKPRYGDKVKLLYTDTGSLTVDIHTDDAHAAFRESTMKQHFDFSDYAEYHPNHDNTKPQPTMQPRKPTQQIKKKTRTYNTTTKADPNNKATTTI